MILIQDHYITFTDSKKRIPEKMLQTCICMYMYICIYISIVICAQLRRGICIQGKLENLHSKLMLGWCGYLVVTLFTLKITEVNRRKDFPGQALAEVLDETRGDRCGILIFQAFALFTKLLPRFGDKSQRQFDVAIHPECH